MVGEFKLHRASRQCSVGKRPLAPGEVFYSVVTEDGDDLARQDIAAEHWTEAPENAIGWWKNRVPPEQPKKRQLAPPEVLVELLRSMGGSPQVSKRRYLLALLLLRKRILKNRETLSLSASPAHSASPSKPDDESEANLPAKLELESTIDGSPIDIEVVAIQASEATSLGEELNELMYQ